MANRRIDTMTDYVKQDAKALAARCETRLTKYEWHSSREIKAWTKKRQAIIEAQVSPLVEDLADAKKRLEHRQDLMRLKDDSIKELEAERDVLKERLAKAEEKRDKFEAMNRRQIETMEDMSLRFVALKERLDAALVREETANKERDTYLHMLNQAKNAAGVYDGTLTDEIKRLKERLAKAEALAKDWERRFDEHTEHGI